MKSSYNKWFDRIIVEVVVLFKYYYFTEPRGMLIIVKLMRLRTAVYIQWLYGDEFQYSEYLTQYSEY